MSKQVQLREERAASAVLPEKIPPSRWISVSLCLGHGDLRDYFPIHFPDHHG